MDPEIRKAIDEAERQLPPTAFLMNSFAWRRLCNEARRLETAKPTA